ncbi:cold shock domain-containing protein [Sulfuritalea sp.]|uniref:cold shock domain-containing protein n=1 Tax=Sulfuritalea sp. TaxID=2480090 RepID=UPI00286D8DD4|nr:cold shock domain-containing protein [Sulfuritalea sp.]
MEPRIEGKLKNWNEDKGFGFITPLNGGQDVFVHISSYPRRGGKPVVGEALSFEVTLNADQKRKAVNVQRLGRVQGKSASPRQPNSSGRRGGSFLGTVTSFALIGVLIFSGYQALMPRLKGTTSPATITAPVTAAEMPGKYFCDGRRYCSQMTSCEEASYFLRHCPGTEMDGNGDGVPCESQWCSSPFPK